MVQTFLRAGVPLSKVQHFRPLLDGGGSPLADRSILTRQCLPAILHTERNHIRQAIAGHAVAVIFDGSTRLGEVLAVIIRVFDNEWSSKQVLMRLKALVRSLMLFEYEGLECGSHMRHSFRHNIHSNRGNESPAGKK